MTTDQRNSREARVWHPLLHQRYGENLYYYLVSIVGYKPNTVSNMADFLRQVGITGFCLYEIYGPFDLLLRAWLNQESKAKLEKWLKETAYIRNHAVCQVIWYRHFSGFTSETTDGTLVERVQAADPSLVLQAVEGQTRAIKNLEDLGLTRSLEVSSDDLVKFYTLIIPTQVVDSDTNAYFQTRLVERLDNAKKDGILSDPSVYSGVGFASAMLKGRFQPRDYYKLGNFILTLSAELAVFQFRLFTLFIANWKSQESDSIAVSSIEATKVHTGIDPELYAWLPEFYAAQLDDTKERRFRALMVQYNYFKGLQSDDRLLVRNLLIAGMFNKEDEYIQLLAGWFIRNESELRELLGRLQNALGITKEQFAAMRTTTRDTGDYSTLGALFRLVMLCLEQEAQESHQELEAKGFNEKSKQIATLRNNVMHGEFQKVFGPYWMDRFEVFATFLPLYRDFRQTVHKVLSAS